MKVGEDYEIVKKIGQGGMGETFLARQISLDRNVVLKRLTSASDEDGYDRLKKEGRLLANLDHPNVVTVMGVVTDAGENYLIEEYFANGRTVRDVIRAVRNGEETLPRKRFAHIAVQLISALEHAHECRIIHRDVKPENILIAPDDRIKLCDFGIARNLESRTSSTSGVKGTWEYLAPELLEDNAALTPAVDAYAAGHVFFELLCGRAPFSNAVRNGVASFLQQKTTTEPRFDGLVPGWAASDVPLLDDLLSLTPDRRPVALRRLKVSLEQSASDYARPHDSDTSNVLLSNDRLFVHAGIYQDGYGMSGSLERNSEGGGDTSHPSTASKVGLVLGILGGTLGMYYLIHLLQS